MHFELWLLASYSTCSTHLIWNKPSGAIPIETLKWKTVWNIEKKNISYIPIWRQIHFSEYDYRSNRVIVRSPMYFKPCNVEFHKYWSIFSLKEREQELFDSIWSFCIRRTFLYFFFLRAFTCSFLFNILCSDTRCNSIQLHTMNVIKIRYQNPFISVNFAVLMSAIETLFKQWRARRRKLCLICIQGENHF